MATGEDSGAPMQVAGTPQAPTTETNEATDTSPDDNPPADPRASTSTPSAKLPVPTDSELKEAVKIVQLRYAGVISQTKTPAAKTVFAKQLLADADKEAEATVRFAIWNQARELAEQGGQVELAFEAIDQQDAQFETDALQLRSASMKRILTAVKRSPNRHWLIWQTFQLADEARQVERYDLALELTDAAGNAARRSGENEMAKSARDQSRRIAHCQELRDAAAALQPVLTTAADDPTANVAQGRYLCFVRNDWDEGTKHLALSDDASLARLAAMDHAKPNSPMEQVAVADGWMGLAGQEDGLSRDAVWRRAAFWYATALPKLTGDARARADEQLALLGDKMGDRSLGIAEKLPWVEGPPGQLKEFKGHTAAVYALAVSGNGRWMISGARDGSVRCWDLATGELRHQIASPFQRVQSVAFTLEDRFIVGHGGTKELAVWDLREGRLANRLPTGKSSIRCIAASSDGELIAWGLRSSRGEDVIVWDLKRRRGYRSLTSGGVVTSLAFSPEGSRLVTGDQRNRVLCWDLTTGGQIFQGTTNYPITQVAFSPNGRHIATLGLQDLRIWDLVRGTEAHRLMDSSNPTKIAFLADGTHLVTAGSGAVSVWDVVRGLRTHTENVDRSSSVGYLCAIAALPDPRAFVVSDDHGNIFLWRLGQSTRQPQL
jgi:hypothetical protein